MLLLMRGFAIAFILGAAALVACSGGQTKTDSSALTLEEFEEGQDEAEKPTQGVPEAPAPDPTRDECRNECSTDEDCCEGYFCGKDPERSQRLTFCMEG
jgi:hypothetical protein